MKLAREDLYTLAMVDFQTSVGKVFVTKTVMSYGDGDEEDHSFFFKDGVRVKILSPAPSDLPHNGLFYPNLVDGWLDPYWPVEVLDKRDELNGFNNFHVFPRSFHQSGIIEGTDNLLPTF